MARPSLRLAVLALAHLLLQPSLAAAQPVTPVPDGVRLVYAAEGVSGCPDEAELRSLVASRIGGVPYVAEGAWEVRVTVRATGGGLEAQVSLLGPDGQERGTHALASEGDCTALMTSVALTLSLVHDTVREESAGRDAGAHGLESSTVGETSESTETSHALTTSERSSTTAGTAVSPSTALPALRWWLGLGPVVGYGLLPSASFGLRAVAAVGGETLVVRIGLRADLPRALNEGTPVLRLGWVLASLGVCGRYRALTACGLARLSVAYVPPAGDPRTTFPRSVGGGLGAELGVRLWGTGRSMLQAHAGFSVPLQRMRVSVEGTPLFRENPLDVTVGLAILWGQP
jgi:hypothetical protein